MVLGLGTVIGGAAEYFPPGTPLTSQQPVVTDTPAVGMEIVIKHDGLNDAHHPSFGLKKGMTGIVVEVAPIAVGQHAGQVVVFVREVKESRVFTVNSFWAFCQPAQ